MMIKTRFLLLIAVILLLTGCASIYSNINYIGKPDGKQCKSKIIKVEVVKDIRKINKPSWYGKNNQWNLYSDKAVSDNVGHMIDVALGLRDCHTDPSSDFILSPELIKLNGEAGRDMSMEFELLYIIKNKNNDILYEGKIVKNVVEKGSWWHDFSIDDLSIFISKYVSIGIDEMLNNDKMWESMKNSDNVVTSNGDKIKERLLLLEELKSNNIISEKDYNNKKSEILKSF